MNALPTPSHMGGMPGLAAEGCCSICIFGESENALLCESPHILSSLYPDGSILDEDAALAAVSAPSPRNGSSAHASTVLYPMLSRPDEGPTRTELVERGSDPYYSDHLNRHGTASALRSERERSIM